MVTSENIIDRSLLTCTVSEAIWSEIMSKSGQAITGKDTYCLTDNAPKPFHERISRTFGFRLKESEKLQFL